MPRIFDVILGRTKPVQADLDALFGLVGAQITLQVSEALVPSGEAGVCFKPVAGRSFAETASEANELLSVGNGGGPAAPIQQEDDKYGFHWIVQSNDDFQELVNQVHLVNSTLQDNGYGPQLLCTVVGFRPDPNTAASTSVPAQAHLVYLYKRGAFYPFVPLGSDGERRDVETELRLANVLGNDVKIEPDKERWMPLWGLPVR